MKKFALLFGALSIAVVMIGSNEIFAEDSDSIYVCHFEENEDGEIIEVCETNNGKERIYCTPECWDV